MNNLEKFSADLRRAAIVAELESLGEMRSEFTDSNPSSPVEQRRHVLLSHLRQVDAALDEFATGSTRKSASLAREDAIDRLELESIVLKARRADRDGVVKDSTAGKIVDIQGKRDALAAELKDLEARDLSSEGAFGSPIYERCVQIRSSIKAADKAIAALTGDPNTPFIVKSSFRGKNQ